jgi:site-specific recombinase XerD
VRSDLLSKYLEHLERRNLSPATIQARREKLSVFISYAGGAFSKKPQDLTLGEMEAYLADRKPRLKPASFAGEASILKGFFGFLKKENPLLQNPFDVLDPVPRWDRTPRNVPDEAQVANLLAQPDCHTYHGIRDRAIMELLYSTGIRSKELLLLRVQDVDLKESFVMILNGKGNRQRLAPFGKSAQSALELYLKVTRPHYLKDPNNTVLFLSKWGNPLKDWAVHEILKNYADRSNHIRGITAHTLRHACALHMLKGGAPIEAVQELLGHRNLATTQVYTRLLPQDLKAVHEKFHPREKEV